MGFYYLSHLKGQETGDGCRATVIPTCAAVHYGCEHHPSDLCTSARNGPSMPVPAFETISCEFEENSGIGRITLNRPDKLNAISSTMREEIHDALDWFAERDETALYEDDEGVAVHVVVLEGAGEKAFSVGVDVDGFKPSNPGVFDVSRFYRRIEHFPAPVIAKVQGYCLGGGLELALACDFRLASADSEFAFPEVDLGTMPACGGTQRAPRLIGPSRTKELCMTGERIDGETASSDGLVDHAYDPDEFPDRAAEFVDQIADRPPLATRAIKDSVNVSNDSPTHVGRRYERRAAAALAETEDRSEGVSAFNEGRKPDWKGR